VVSLLLRQLDYSKMVLLRSFPEQYESEVIGNVKRSPYPWLYLSYRKYNQVNEKRSKEVPNPFEKEIAEGRARLGPLKREYIPIVESKWIYFTPGNTMIRDSITNCPSICLEVKNPETGKFIPIAWVLLTTGHFVGNLHTEEKYRRKGLAQLLLSRFTEQLFQEELFQKIGLQAEVDPENHASLELFQNLGWEIIGTKMYIRIKPHEAKL